MSLSLAPGNLDRFAFVSQGDSNEEPLQQLHVPLDNEKAHDLDPASVVAAMGKFQVIFDDSTKGCNIKLNIESSPFIENHSLSPAESTASIPRTSNIVDKPILYHSAGMWRKSKKSFCAKVDMRTLYYQHFLNIQKVSQYQLSVVSSLLLRAKRSSRVEDSITLSLFLHETSGLRNAIDADVELFRKWHDGEFRGSLRRKFSSELMLFKGYVDELNDYWKQLSSEELFQLPILKMLSRSPAEILTTPIHTEVKSINQRTYFNTLVHQLEKDRGHTLI